MFISSTTEKLQLNRIFMSGKPEMDEPLFMDLEKYLKTMDVDPAWITFNTQEQKLNIYVKDFGAIGCTEEFLTQNITDEETGLVISNKWAELAADHHYLSEISDNVEVLIKNFTKKYLIFLSENCASSIKEAIQQADMEVKPVHFFCGTSASFTIFYRNTEDYEKAILTKSVFKLMRLIDEQLALKDNLKLYKPHTIKLEILHLDLHGLRLME